MNNQLTELEILKKRAEKLEKAPTSENLTPDLIEVLEFKLGDNIYCIETAYIKEVVNIKDVVRLPKTPFHLIGIYNLRGDIIPVYDIHFIFENKPLSSKSGIFKTIIISKEGSNLALIVDELLGITKKKEPLDEVKQHSSFSDFIKLIFEDMTALLNPETLLNDSQFKIQEN